ncbi:MAG: ATP-dependent Clp protease ATP-binding subunit ClpA, partial [Muribaculaceae bacterium]|nr:ATP-dependent Clp protease ATP-binding subunit ClpA [Muribaculaceae bacterium]
MENTLPFHINTYNPLEEEAVKLLSEAYVSALKQRNEYITPEHVLRELTNNLVFSRALKQIGGNEDDLIEKLETKLGEIEKVPEELDYSPTPSLQLLQMVEYADQIVFSCGKSSIELTHIIKGLLSLEESWAQYFLMDVINEDEGFFLTLLLGDVPSEEIEEGEESPFEEDFPSLEMPENEEKKKDWKKLVICVNDIYKDQNPLIGRKEELSKTIRVLCRKDKNNPLHIGEPGVGKTALVYGLAKIIDEGKVPEKLKESKIYRMDLGSLIAGTQFRGDFERKIKTIM